MSADQGHEYTVPDRVFARYYDCLAPDFAILLLCRGD